MKFFSVVILVMLFSESHASLFSTFAHIFPDLNAENIVENFDCIVEAVRNVVKGDDEVASWSDDAIAEIQKLKIEVFESGNKYFENDNERIGCMQSVTSNAIFVVADYFAKLVAAYKWELVKEIKDKCFSDDKPINAQEKFIADVYQYYVNIIEKVSKQNGLSDLWAKTKPQIQKELDEWKEGRRMSEFSQVVCRVRNGAVVVKLIDEYLHEAQAINSYVVAKIENETNQKIVGFDQVKQQMTY